MKASSGDEQALRTRLIDGLKIAGVIVTDSVERALRHVPRHRFIPESDLAAAYTDAAVIVKWAEDGSAISSVSQPTIVATMLEMLQAHRGHRVLEVGTGTGYNAALLAVLVEEHGRVVSVELEPDLAERAACVLSEVGAHHVDVVVADGSIGCPQHTPYDRVIVTTGAREITDAWVEQLGDGGRLVVPIVDASTGIGSVVSFKKAGDALVRLEETPCGFLPMRS